MTESNNEYRSHAECRWSAEKSQPQLPNQPLLPHLIDPPCSRDPPGLFPEFLPNRPDLSPAFLVVLQWVYGRRSAPILCVPGTRPLCGWSASA